MGNLFYYATVSLTHPMTMTIDNSLGEALRELRIQTQLGIKTAAPKAGISYGYLSKVENDLKAPSQGLIIELCKIYGVNPDELIAKLGVLPDDIKAIVKEHGKDVFDLLRSTYTKDN